MTIADGSGPKTTSARGPRHTRVLFGLPMLYWGLWLAILILWMGRFVTSFLSIYLVSALHIDEGIVGTVVSMYGFGGILGCLFGGALSDRFGRQSMIVVGEVGAAVMLLIVSVLADPLALGAALFVYGAAASLPSPAIAAYIADVVPVRNQQRAYTLQSWAINFGYAIGPIIANQLVKVSYSLMFYVEAAVMIAVTALLIVFFRETRRKGLAVPTPYAAACADGGRAGGDAGSATGRENGGTGIGNAGTGNAAGSVGADTHVGGDGDVGAPGGSEQPVSLLRGYCRVLTDGPFMAFTLLMFGYYLVYFQSTSGLPIAMTELGMGTGEYSVLLTINGGMLCLLQIPAMKVFKRMGNSRVLVCGLAVTVIGYAVQIIAGSWGGFALATVLWTLGELGTFPIATTIVASMAPAAVRGTYQGVYNMVWSMSIALAPLVGGWVISHVGGRALWVACTAVLALVTFGLWATKRSRERTIAGNLRDSIDLSE